MIGGVFTGGGRDVPGNHYLPEKLACPLLVARAGVGDVDGFHGRLERLQSVCLGRIANRRGDGPTASGELLREAQADAARGANDEDVGHGRAPSGATKRTSRQ